MKYPFLHKRKFIKIITYPNMRKFSLSQTFGHKSTYNLIILKIILKLHIIHFFSSILFSNVYVSKIYELRPTNYFYDFFFW